jgi:hypothetical protein
MSSGNGSGSSGRRNKKPVLVSRTGILVFFAAFTLTLISMARETTYLKGMTMSSSFFVGEELLKTRTKKKPDIAIISSYVSSSQWAGSPKRLDEAKLDQLINKACYANRHGYDFIFNMTYGFFPERDNPKGKAYWQEYGTWSRVPHIADRIQDYKWILYADIDYIILNMSRPLEAFFHDWETYNRTPSVLVAKDELNFLATFSAFAVLIKNSTFGRGVLDHWMGFARGVCEKGNFAPGPRRYTWGNKSMRNSSRPCSHLSHYPHSKRGFRPTRPLVRIDKSAHGPFPAIRIYSFHLQRNARYCRNITSLWTRHE